MKKTNSLFYPKARTLRPPLSRRKFLHGAALLAATMMAGSAMAQDLTVDNPLVPYNINNETQIFDSVFLLNNGIINGTGTAGIDASVLYGFEAGSVLNVNLSGAAGLLKTTAGFVLLTGSNSYTGPTVIADGVLQLGNGTSGSISGDSAFLIGPAGVLNLNLPDDAVFSNTVVNDGGINSISSNFLTISGPISGTGTFTQSGFGTTVLTGANSYTGDTTITNGTLTIGDGVSGSISDVSLITLTNPGATLGINLADGGTLANNIVNDGYIEALAAGTNFITGEISGTGSLDQLGLGTTVITGANSYSGGTGVVNGILQVGDGLTVGSTLGTGGVTVAPGAELDINLADGDSFANDVLNDGSVRAIASGLNTIDGIISGAGSFIQDGFGTTVLTAENTYTGATAVLNGTLVLANSFAISDQSAVQVDTPGTLDMSFTTQTIGSLSDGPNGGGLVDVTDATLVTGFDNTNTTFSGVLTGDDFTQVVKVGTGTWRFTGIGDYTGSTFVEDGALVVDGFIGGNVQVDEEGTLAGRGFIAGSVFNRGVITGGSTAEKPVGTLTIDGDFVQDDSGTYVAKLRTKSKYDRLAIGGTAFLNGDLVVLGIDGFKRKAGRKFTILTADGGIVGRFDNQRDNFEETMLELDTRYTANSVVIEFDQRKFASLSGLNHNEREVAKALDRAVSRDRLGNLIDTLNEVPINDVRDQLSILSPEDLAQIFQIGFATAQVQYVNLERRLDDVRGGARGFSTNGLALTNSRGTVNYDGAPIVNDRDGLSLAGWDGKSVVSKKTVVPLEEVSRWGFFITGSGQWADVETTSEARGSEFTTGGVTVGADYRVNENFVVGIAGGYAHTNSDLRDDGHIDVNSGRGSIYMSWFGSGAYLNATVGGAYNSYDTRRSTVGGRADGDTDGGEFNSLIGGGYDFCLGGFTIGPVGSLQYTYIGLSSFEENGSDAPMEFPSQDQNSLRSLLGLKATYAWNCGGVVIKPEVRAQWLHEYMDSTASIDSGFVGGAGVFTVNGVNIGRDGLLVDAGVSVEFNPRVAVFAYYTGDLCRTNYSAHAVNGGFRIAF